LRGLPAGPNAQAVLVSRLKGGEKTYKDEKILWLKSIDALLAILG
jgi:hypothetical protein